MGAFAGLVVVGFPLLMLRFRRWLDFVDVLGDTPILVYHWVDSAVMGAVLSVFGSQIRAVCINHEDARFDPIAFNALTKAGVKLEPLPMVLSFGLSTKPRVQTSINVEFHKLKNESPDGTPTHQAVRAVLAEPLMRHGVRTERGRSSIYR